MALRGILAGLAAATLGLPAHADTIDISDMQPHERCARCHELDGNSVMPRFPRLAGQSAAYVKKQLADFRTGRRTNDEGGMSGIAETLTAADIAAVSRHFAKQVPRVMAGGEDGDAALGRKLYVKGRPGVAACVSCHGPASRAATGAPFIAGQHAGYLEKQLLDFRRGARRNDADRTMRRIAGALNDSEIRALALFVSGPAALAGTKKK